MTAAEDTLDRARVMLASLEPDPPELCKTIWGSPAGKKKLAVPLAALLPEHKTYVEPFCGSAAVFFSKPQSPVEVLNDLDSEIATAFRTIKRLTPNKLSRLRAMDWVGNVETYRKLRESRPKGELGRLHRFLYMANHSFGRTRGTSVDPKRLGQRVRAPERIEQHQPRLKSVRVSSGDYENVCRRHDGKDTVFFLDPPYKGHDGRVGEGKFDEARFFDLLRALKGKWLLTYGKRGDLPRMLRGTDFVVREFTPQRHFRNKATREGVLPQLLVANYDVSKQALRQLRSKRAITGHELQLIKAGSPDERFVLGVVLEPEVTDAQGDIYSAEEVRTAAHRFLSDAPAVWFMHHTPLERASVRILESYIAPTDIEFPGGLVRKGTWLLALRILDDSLWGAVKRGELTGLSIRGSAIGAPAADAEERVAA
jgi:DNA adenine methylase